LEDLEYAGLTEEWGVYEDLRTCFREGEPFLEHPIIEYRYKNVNPERYAFLVDRYGHIAKDGSKRYTATSFLGGALGRMLHHGDLEHRSGPGTGCFHYDTVIGYWALASDTQDRPLESWAEYAREHRLDPDVWEL
jgi:hypothetical protein